jgi:dimethylamine monooxygenase subunit A
MLAPPDYFPPAGGRYEVKPGLVRFGRDLGGGEADRHVFQIDASFPHYHRAKLAARAERPGKYFQTHRFEPHVADAVNRFIVSRLTAEHSAHFSPSGDQLHCGLTGDKAPLDFDALAMQVQEDLAVVSTEDEGRRHWLSAVHLSFPNHWAAEDKIGKTFALIHEPVAAMEQMNRQADSIVRLMLEATDGLVRFAWGVTFDDLLNHHPQPPPGAKRVHTFDPSNPRTFLRVERQTVWGFPNVGAALFTIRTYLHDFAQIRRDPARRAALAAAIRSMTPASLAYKGLAESRDALLAWFEKPDET